MTNKLTISLIVLLTLCAFVLPVYSRCYYPPLPFLLIIISTVLLSISLYLLFFKRELYALIPLPFLLLFSFLTISIFQLYQYGK
jgi:hypothetical protein